jgi:hypothetical protein
MKALFLAGAMVLASTSAWATIAVSYSIDGALATTCASSAGNIAADCGTFVNGPFSVNSLAASSNSPGTSSLSDLFSATTSLTNTSGATHTIEFFIFADGFNVPTSGTLISSLGGTVVSGSVANLVSYQSCLSTTAGAVCPLGSIVAGPGTPGITNPGAFSDSKTTVVSSLSAPYTVSEDVKFTLGAGSSINFSASTFTSAVPEPMTFSLMGAGLLGLGLLRKRISRS